MDLRASIEPGVFFQDNSKGTEKGIDGGHVDIRDGDTDEMEFRSDGAGDAEVGWLSRPKSSREFGLFVAAQIYLIRFSTLTEAAGKNNAPTCKATTKTLLKTSWATKCNTVIKTKTFTKYSDVVKTAHGTTTVTQVTTVFDEAPEATKAAEQTCPPSKTVKNARRSCLPQPKCKSCRKTVTTTKTFDCKCVGQKPPVTVFDYKTKCPGDCACYTHTSWVPARRCTARPVLVTAIQ
ncbi:hypothetical protein H072_6560 [Dactylellina haptotyla CBS 200.50]|uniref:Uncharacterized protein n=1 Tax=Dactylellina haptotyla (strain CBS 200.50) TaxID=1284197 RepID=S8A9E4_DACHA|nr:hypothetical protein H072_6560 [Dactylellina haptotyla CBS 200.50]